MQDSLHLLFSILILLNVVFFFLGYIVGKLNCSTSVLEPTEHSNLSSKNKFQKPTKSISIDETKFVTDIKIDNLEKKYDSLGDKKISSEKITDSITKLKNIKK